MSSRFRRGRLTGLLAVVAFLGIASVALAPGRIGFSENPGVHKPPPTLGGFKMKKFGLDPQPIGMDVTSVQGPTGQVSFSRPVSHRQVGDGWLNWGNGYTG